MQAEEHPCTCSGGSKRAASDGAAAGLPVGTANRPPLSAWVARPGHRPAVFWTQLLWGPFPVFLMPLLCPLCQPARVLSSGSVLGLICQD